MIQIQMEKLRKIKKKKDCPFGNDETCSWIDCPYYHGPRNFELILSKIQCYIYYECLSEACEYAHAPGCSPRENIAKQRLMDCKDGNCNDRNCLKMHGEQAQTQEVEVDLIPTSTIKIFTSENFFFSTIMKFADRISEHKRHYYESPKTPTNPKQQKPKPYGVILFVSLFQALLFECKFRARFPKIRTQYHTYTKPPTTILPKTITVKEMVKTTPNRKKATLKIGQENWNGFIEEFTKEYSGKNIVILGTHFEEIISSSIKILHGSLISKELFEKKTE